VEAKPVQWEDGTALEAPADDAPWSLALLSPTPTEVCAPHRGLRGGVEKGEEDEQGMSTFACVHSGHNVSTNVCSSPSSLPLPGRNQNHWQLIAGLPANIASVQTLAHNSEPTAAVTTTTSSSPPPSPRAPFARVVLPALDALTAAEAARVPSGTAALVHSGTPLCAFDATALAALAAGDPAACWTTLATAMPPSGPSQAAGATSASSVTPSAAVQPAKGAANARGSGATAATGAAAGATSEQAGQQGAAGQAAAVDALERAGNLAWAPETVRWLRVAVLCCREVCFVLGRRSTVQPRWYIDRPISRQL